jgi:hypothetical protein
MPSAVRLREDYSSESFGGWPGGRRPSARAGGCCRWLRSGTAWTEVRRRRSAAWTARRCATGCIRFNASGPEGLIDNWTDGPKPRLSAAQPAEFAQVVDAGPDREKDGVVRWRRIDLKRVIAERFGVDVHELCRKTSAQARLLAHERKAASSGAGREDRRGG